jgi:hypothetical protein
VALPAVVRHLVRAWVPWSADLGEGMELWDVAQAMNAALPEEWRRAVGRCPGPAPQGVGVGRLDPRQVQLPCGQADPIVQQVVQRLGWGDCLLTGVQRAKETPPPWHLSVRAATRHQLRPLFGGQVTARGVYVVDALVAVGAPGPQDKVVLKGRRRLEAGMRELWKLQWERRWMEALWRLAANGVPGAGGHGVDQRGPCPCGWAGPAAEGVDERCRAWRHHHFWGCPVAQAVVEQVQRALPQPPLQPQQLQPAPPQVLRDQVWLLRPPPSVRTCVWEVVCVAVLDAMWYGRKLLWALELARAQQQPVDPTQRLITDFLPIVGGVAPPAPPTVGECAAARSAARFWDVLESLVALGHVPKGQRWLEVAADHPFIGVQLQPTPENPGRQHLVLNMPQAGP